MRAKLFVDLEMISLGEEMQIHLAHDRPVTIRIVHDLLRPVPACDPQEIIAVALFLGKYALEETVALYSLHRIELIAVVRQQHDFHFLCVRPENADHEIVSQPVRSQHSERIVMRPQKKRGQLIRRQTEKSELAHVLAILGRLRKMSCADFLVC